MTEHTYLSTSCFHDMHDYCQATMVAELKGEDSAQSAGWRIKRPAQCKFCAAPCTCSCHEEHDET